MPPQSFNHWSDLRTFLDNTADSIPVLAFVIVMVMVIGIMLGMVIRDAWVNRHADRQVKGAGWQA